MKALAFLLFLVSGPQENEWLAVERAKAKLEQLQSEARRIDRMVEEGLVSEVEAERIRAQLRLAELDLDESLWRLWGARFRVIVEDSFRRPRAGGLDDIELVLALPALEQIPERFGGERPGVAQISVSLVDRGVVVAVPYVATVPFLAPGERRRLRFELLRPAESLTVVLQYRGEREELTLLPRRAEADQPFRVTVTQPDLTTGFGLEASYELRVEPLGSGEESVALEVQGLPAGCQARFRDAATGAFVSSLRLLPGSGPQRLELLVQLPESETASVKPDQELPLRLVLRSRNGQAVESPLTLRPRGVPRVELESGSWLIQARAGAEIPFLLQAVNRGTAPAVGVRLEVEPAEGVSLAVEPERLDRLEVGERKSWNVRLSSRQDAVPGEYRIPLRPRWEGQEVRSRTGESFLRIHLEPRRSWLTVLGLAGVVILLAVGIRIGLRRLRVD